ncbi:MULTISPECIES: vWA domain-containing protein [unclassified Nocardiopsis]|uniref:vWA domain-containing protein n=1 Tax=Nocardiopsis TaxID=2013 RepID=UPI00387B9273
MNGHAAQAVERLAAERFAAARLWAAARAPYLAHALFSLTPVVLEPRRDEDTGEPVPDPDFRAFPTDPGWRVHIDPGTALAVPVEEFGWWLLHGVGHLVRRHADRAPEGAAGPGDPAARRWNRAADAEVNDDLEAAGLECPAGVVSPRALGLAPGRLAEEYLSEIEVLDEAQARGGRSVGDLVDCGRSADGLDRSYERAGGDALSEVERAVLEAALARDIAARAAARSDVPGGWERWARERLRPAVDWRARLGAVLRRGAYRGAGRVDFTYRRPARRQGPPGPHGRVLLPAMAAPAPEVAVVVDTSGSVDDGVLRLLVAEVAGVLERAGGAGRRLRVICCDRHAHPVQTVRRAQDLRLVGGGGTDLREGIAAAAGLCPDLVLVLTDGDTPWPQAPPRMPLVVGLVAGSAAPRPPAWAHVVPIPARP